MYQEFLPVALEAIKSAEQILLHYYKQDVRARLKADQSPVTIADEEAEIAMRGILSKAFPDHRFIGEEGGTTTEASEFKWIIDPIDGTKNFLRHIPLFGSLLALMHNNEIVLGISNAPLMNELAHAVKGQGAFINDQQVHVSKTENLKDAWVTYGGLNYFEKHNRFNAISDLIMQTSRQRAIGDLWGYHLIVSGKFDVLLEAQTKIWDVAPAVILLQEAGGKVTDMDGKDIDANSNSVLATNGLLHDQVLEVIK